MQRRASCRLQQGTEVARTLGVGVRNTLVGRADEVIE
jgi:hypothetical protein